MATASLVLGIVTIVLVFIPFINFVCPVTGILSIIFGIIALCKNREEAKKFSKPVVGILLATLSIIISYFVIMFYGILGIIMLDEIEDYDDSYYQDNYYEYNRKNKKVDKYSNYYSNDYYKNDRKR